MSETRARYGAKYTIESTTPTATAASAGHARKNALIPVATIGGIIFIGLLSGVVITESIYNLPGMGRLFADAALNLDIVTLLGLTLFNGVVLVIGNLAVDVLYGFIDPRVRLS